MQVTAHKELKEFLSVLLVIVATLLIAAALGSFFLGFLELSLAAQPHDPRHEYHEVRGAMFIAYSIAFAAFTGGALVARKLIQ